MKFPHLEQVPSGTYTSSNLIVSASVEYVLVRVVFPRTGAPSPPSCCAPWKKILITSPSSAEEKKLGGKVWVSQFLSVHCHDKIPRNRIYLI